VKALSGYRCTESRDRPEVLAFLYRPYSDDDCAPWRAIIYRMEPDRVLDRVSQVPELALHVPVFPLGAESRANTLRCTRGPYPDSSPAASSRRQSPVILQAATYFHRDAGQPGCGTHHSHLTRLYTRPAQAEPSRQAFARTKGNPAAGWFTSEHAEHAQFVRGQDYAMRPSRHGQGHDAALLAAVLPIARSQGIDPVIMIRDDSDIAARDAIEACGGCASIRSA
jgi:hypothetical protein